MMSVRFFDLCNSSLRLLCAFLLVTNGASAVDSHYQDALFLTPFIESGDIQGGVRAATVKPFYGEIKSYSGFLTVNKLYNSNLFFWFFPAEIEDEKAPVILWLQGGPGTSSMLGLFTEHGPFYLSKNMKLKQRDYYWTKNMNLLYIDNPVGTGFSFTENDKGYSTNQSGIGENLYSAIRQFYQLFTKYKKNDLYIAGESYAGKYVPILAYTIDQKNVNLKEQHKINLKGISIGNGICDPSSLLMYDEYWYQLGLIDLNCKLKVEEIQEKLQATIKQQNYVEAFKLNLLLKEIFYKNTGFTYYYNYLHSDDDSPFGDVSEFLSDTKIRRAIHVGNLTFNYESTIVEKYLVNEVMQSVKSLVESLLEKYKVLIYNGQLDIIVAYPLTENFIKSLKWSGANDYKNAKRKIWFVDKELAGYMKNVGNFTEVLVRNAGHMVPSDQPKWALHLIEGFIFNYNYSTKTINID